MKERLIYAHEEGEIYIYTTNLDNILKFNWNWGIMSSPIFYVYKKDIKIDSMVYIYSGCVYCSNQNKSYLPQPEFFTGHVYE